MSQILYIIRKHYFLTCLTASALVSVAAADLAAVAIQASLQPDAIQPSTDSRTSSRRPARNGRGTPAGLGEFDTILTGNLLRDSPEELEKVQSGAPDNIVLTGTVAGPWHLAMATIRVDGQPKTKEYPSGATVEDYRIVWIGRGKVVVRDQTGERYTIKATDKKPSPRKRRRSSRRKRTEAKAGGTITKVISRDEVTQLVKNPKTLYRGLRIGPKMVGSKIAGYRLKRLSRSHFFYKLGARAGDTITRINGQDMDNHEKMLGLLQDLKTANKLSVDVDRRGTPTSFNIIIK